MDEAFKYVQLAFAFAGGILGAFLGGLDSLLYMLIGFVVADYITGISAAIVEKKLSSQIGFKGILQKIAIFVLVGLGHVIDSQMIGAGSTIRTAVIMFYLSNEGISITENVARIGLPLPKKLLDVLLQLKPDSVLCPKEKEEQEEE